MRPSRRRWRRIGEDERSHGETRQAGGLGGLLRAGARGRAPAGRAGGIVVGVVGGHVHGHAVHAHAEGRGLRRGTGAGPARARHYWLRRGVPRRQSKRFLAHPDRQRAPLGVEAGDVQLPVARGGAGHWPLPGAAAAGRASRCGGGHPGGRLRGGRVAGHQRHAGADASAGTRGLGRRDLRRGRGVVRRPGRREPRVRRAAVQRRGRTRRTSDRRRRQCADGALSSGRWRSGVAAGAFATARRRQDLHALRLSGQGHAATGRRGGSRPGARRGAPADRHHARFLGLPPRQLPRLSRRRRGAPLDRARPAPERPAGQLRQRDWPWLLHRRGCVAQRGFGGRSDRVDRARARRRFLDRAELAAAGGRAGAAGRLVRRLRGGFRGRSGRGDEQQAVQGHCAREERRGAGDPAHRLRLLRPRGWRVSECGKPADRPLGGRWQARRRWRSGGGPERGGDPAENPRAADGGGRHVAGRRDGIERASADPCPALGCPPRRLGHDRFLSGLRHPLRWCAVPRAERPEAEPQPRAPRGTESAPARFGQRCAGARSGASGGRRGAAGGTGAGHRSGHRGTGPGTFGDRGVRSRRR